MRVPGPEFWGYQRDAAICWLPSGQLQGSLHNNPPDSKLAITYPCKLGHRPSQEEKHKPSPVAEYTLGLDLVSPPRLQELQSYKVPHKNITCFQPLANGQRSSVNPAASLLPMGTSERTTTGKLGNKIVPSHPLNEKSQHPGGHREVGVSRQE